MLKEEGLEFYYEPFEVELQPPFKMLNESFEKDFDHSRAKAVRSITYTPDFVGKGWVMECKGKRTPDFNIKWKMFLHTLHKKRIKQLLLMPSSKKQIAQCIQMIKKLKKSRFLHEQLNVK
jgi:hypothetical protein